MGIESLMHYKTKRSEAKQVLGDRQSVSLESEKEQHKETISSASLDKNKDFTRKNPKDAGLSEKFFLSDFTED